MELKSLLQAKYHQHKTFDRTNSKQEHEIDKVFAFTYAQRAINVLILR